MTDNEKSAIFLKLQQVVLDNEDNKSLVDNLLARSLTEFSGAGLDFYFISVVFLDQNGAVYKTFYTDQGGNSPDKISSKIVHKVDAMLKDGSAIKTDLLANKLATFPEVEAFFGYTNQNIQDGGIGIFSPVFVANKLTGVITLATGKPSVDEETKELIEIFTNLVGFCFRLQDTQASLTEITQEVYKMNAQLHDLDKAKDEFVSIVSHELRTPMTAIKSYVWLALNGRAGKLNDQMKNYLTKVYESSERLIGLINDVLDVSHIETGRIQVETQPISPLKVAQEVADTLAPRATEQEIELKIKKDEHVPMVASDPMKLNEILVNLVGNALKFTPKGGTITVSFAKQGGFVETSVTDTGIGISKEDLSKLFTKFGRIAKNYSTIAQSTGSGLGLYITKNYVEIMGGKIWINSEEGKGSTFTFSLPVASEHKAKRK
ncbi:MAG: HAMP domain-containing sensor histidine kinase [Candidatus Woykebacteria bacterium]